MLAEGTRVWCQYVDNGRFGGVDKNDQGEVRHDTMLRDGSPCLIVVWDNDGQVDMLTDTGFARHWPWRVLPVPSP